MRFNQLAQTGLSCNFLTSHVNKGVASTHLTEYKKKGCGFILGGFTNRHKVSY